VGDEALEAAKDLAAFGLNGNVVKEREIELAGRKGREHTIEVEGRGEVRVRNLPAGRRMYSVLVAYQPRFLNAKAAQYFLESLRVE
jgi:hypothetical protein